MSARCRASNQAPTASLLSRTQVRRVEIRKLLVCMRCASCLAGHSQHCAHTRGQSGLKVLSAVRILGPHHSEHIRPGRTVKVIVRVSKTDGDYPQELETSESFPSGWTLVLSQDGGPDQAVGPKSGHIGDFRGLVQGPHLLRFSPFSLIDML